MSGIRARDFQFLLVVVAVVGLLTVLSMTGKERFIPRTEAHLAVAPIVDTAQADAVCLSCHGGERAASVESKNAPLMPKNHPLRKKNCRQCHRLERKKS
jgi:Tfp pilus assembly protein PilE